VNKKGVQELVRQRIIMIVIPTQYIGIVLVAPLQQETVENGITDPVHM
jgi:hypothetical protein